MQWVETTGRTIEDAKDAALDQLGIDESEAEFEILEEAKTGLFGRVRSDARVRARVIPKTPRPKQERRPRRARPKRDGAASPTDGERATTGSAPADDQDAPTAGAETPAAPSETNAPTRRRRSRSRSGSSTGGASAPKQEDNQMTDDAVNVDQQADMISEFLEGLLGALAVDGEITRTKVDDDTIELGVTGADDLGLLIGPKGQTLTAVHELSRTVLQRRATGRHDGRVRIDIGGYRQRRAEALARFVTAQADVVLDEGVSRALEPMNAVDRKVVHDTINGIDGVSTVSEGVDPNRRVVLVLDAE